METLNLDLSKRYTYADYLTWMDEKRREIFNGFVKLMTPAPSRKHQEISFNLTRILGNYLIRKNCKAYHAPSDVRLPKGKNNKKDNEKLYQVKMRSAISKINTRFMRNMACASTGS